MASDAARTDTNDNGFSALEPVNGGRPPSLTELPFLVTHWLANYSQTGEEGDQQREEAIERLRNATSEMAAAFSSLGAYGTSSRPTFQTDEMQTRANNATYGDMVRRWQPVPPSHLESLVQSAASATVASESVASRASTNLLLAAQESQPDAQGGRRLTDGPQLATAVPPATSMLQSPALFGPSKESDNQILSKATKNDALSLAVESDSSRLGEAAGKAMREYLSLREEHQKAEIGIKKLNKEVTKQQVLKERLENERESILAHGNEEAAEHVARLNQIAEGLLNTDRLIPQHIVNLSKLEESQRTRTEKLLRAKELSETGYSKLSATMKRFRDPSHGQKFSSVPVRIPCCVPRENSSFFDAITRQYGGGGNFGPRLPKRIQGGTPSDASAAETRKTILARRLSYSMTASAHLAFPVFCLCFDKTGRYFVTGADDCLVKLFYIGAARSKATTQRTFSYGSNDRSAVLVCTLRGHAGVICDIDVSSDNAFLATASDDGDCRVWGLKDGAPIAILRGHKDGANMVSWSELMPYRLVTTGSDGLARMWDIREAAINRYGAHVGKREDYTLPLAGNGRSTNGSEEAGASSSILASGDELLPPLPLRNGGSVEDGPAGSQGNAGDGAENVAVGAGNAAGGGGEAGGGDVQPGQFVRNDVLDEGVRLVTKLQHGAPPDQNLPGASTRSRRKAVKVICIARCPKGGHFATGAEDGICRVWSEEDGGDVIAKQDNEHAANYFQSGQRPAERRSARVQHQSEGRLLAELTGHVNSITDLHYSHAGDRILTASQKDGVARVWSWTESHVDAGSGTFSNVKQILLQVKKPESLAPTGAPSRRRAAASNASCDVAVWMADDSRIVTSQCCLVKEGSAEIVEGSQYLLVWDSRNGQCLLGISSAHNAQVPVLVPHPSISTLLCSAGGDGIAKLWDLEKGECVNLHENKLVDIGPVADSSEQQRKYSGYLDGSFSPDGLSLILTDDSGRFTLFSIADGSSDESDSEASSFRRSSSTNQRIPSWMKEQYFANDYYELYFDTNGYCVERGSGQPPHLAPRSVRCSFTGEPWAEEVNDVFSRLRGPLPLSEDACRRNRDELRYQSFLAETGIVPENTRTNLVSYFDPLRTVLIDGKRSSVVSASDLPSVSETSRQPSHAAGHEGGRHGANQRGRATARSTLSSNYRWRGYEEIMAEEAARDEEEDADDDDYVAPAARRSPDDEDLSDDIFMTESEGEEGSHRITRHRRSSARSGRSRRRRREREQALSYEERSRARPTRVSARQLNRTQPEHYEDESESSDAFVEEFLSTNNTPSGPHVEDYTVAGHYFKLPDSGRVRRQWLLRTENRTSYNGSKNYAPQVGDSVVYIPRAHYETLKVFPTLDAPWKHFERGARWPVVRCSVKDIRYRFPYEQYYRSQNEARCLSVVAILTLEVTGIPSLSGDDIFPWPTPSFVERQTRGQVFEVSMFESDCPEFVVPEALFTWRLQAIESAAGRTRRQNELPVVAYFSSAAASQRSRSNREDRELEAFAGTMKKLLQNSEREPDEHLLSSGYGTLEIEWDSGDPSSILSPWEVSLQDKAYETPSPPSLSTTATRAVANALAKIEARPQVEEYFLHPVDEARYSDYRNRVEVPMNFSFIKERLAAGYYSSVRSVLSDAKLIRDNCLKYNGPCDLSQFASDIYDSFENEVKSHVDINESPVQESLSPAPGGSALAQNDFGAPSRSSRLARRQRQETGTRASRRSGSEDGGTSLERLPSPQERASTSRTTRRRTAEPSRRRTRRGEVVSTEASGRSTRSSTSRSVLAGNSHDDSTDESSVVQSDKNDDDGSFAADQDEHGGEDSFEESSDESMSDDDIAQRRATRRSSRKSSNKRTTRKSTRAMTESAGAGISSSDEWDDGQRPSSEEESEVSQPPTRRSRRQTTPESGEEERVVSPRRATRASMRSMFDEEDLGANNVLENGRASRSTGAARRSTRPSTLAGGIEDSPRRSTRAHVTKSMADLSHSDTDEDESENVGESENEDSEERATPVRRRGALKRRSDNTLVAPGRGKRRKVSPTRSSPRRKSGRPTRGAHSAESMADEDGDELEQEEPPMRTGRRGGAPKRARGASSESRPSRRVRSQQRRKSEEFPELKPWPMIDLKAITKVCEAVLNHLALLDEGGVFAVPVVEQAPELKETYLSVIENPMDFRTIEEDKMQYYESIQDLQDDLILVFRNCATFNKSTSEYHAFAITMWEQLNDIFRNVCREQDVMLPRRW